MLTMTSPLKSQCGGSKTQTTWVWRSRANPTHFHFLLLKPKHILCLAQDPFWALPIALLEGMVAFVAWHVVWLPARYVAESLSR